MSAYDDDWHAARIVAACRARGKVAVVAPTAFSLRAGRTTTVLAGGSDARRCDVWLTPRALGEEGDHDFQCAVYTALGELGLPMVNAVPALLTARDKPRCSWLLARAGVPTPPVVAVQTLAEGLAALGELHLAVAKPPYGSLGIGVARVAAGRTAAGRAARALLDRMLRRHGMLYLQRWREGQDVRLFVVGDQVISAVTRTPRRGDFRGNAHQGGHLAAVRPAAATARLAVRAARALGLEYAGVDVLEGASGPTVLEVNGTPRWDGIHRATGRDLAADIVAHAARLVTATTTERSEHA